MSALFISNEMCSPYYPIKKISEVIVAETNRNYQYNHKIIKTTIISSVLIIFVTIMKKTL